MKVWQWHLIKLDNISALHINGLYFACSHVLGTLAKSGLSLIGGLQGETRSCETLVFWWMGWLPGPGLTEFCAERSTGRGFPLQSEYGNVTSSLDREAGGTVSTLASFPCRKALPVHLSHAAVSNSPVYLSSSSIHFSCCDARSLYRLGVAVCFMSGSGWPPPPLLCRVPSVHQVSTNIAWRQCQFCKHWEAIIKSLLAIPGMCPKLLLYREVMFSELLPYRGLVKPLGRIRHCLLCPDLKGLFLEGNVILAGTLWAKTDQQGSGAVLTGALLLLATRSRLRPPLGWTCPRLISITPATQTPEIKASEHWLLASAGP